MVYSFSEEHFTCKFSNTNLIFTKYPARHHYQIAFEINVNLSVRNLKVTGYCYISFTKTGLNSFRSALDLVVCT